jgi:tetratricopeptide (TPR) repeat protein
MKTMRVLLFVGLTSVLLPIVVSAQSGSLEDGKRLFEQKDYKAAKIVFEELTESDAKNHEAFYHLGRSLFELEQYKESVKALEESIKIHPSSSDYHAWLGYTLGRRMNEVDIISKITMVGKLQESLKTAIELDPSNLEARWALWQYLLVAPAIAGGNVEEAKKQALEIKKLEKYRGYVALIAVFTEEGNYEDAFDLCEEVLIELHDKAPFLYQMGRISALSGERLDRGIECLKMYLNSELETTSITPGKDVAYWVMGRIYEHKNDIESATRAYEDALKNNPTVELAKKALKKIRK